MLMFSTWLSATVFHALSGIICITAVLGYGFGQETGTEASRMLLVGFILYILPVLSGWAVMNLTGYSLAALVAGGSWHDGANCGARAVNCSYYPWDVNTTLAVL